MRWCLPYGDRGSQGSGRLFLLLLISGRGQPPPALEFLSGLLLTSFASSSCGTLLALCMESRSGWFVVVEV